MKTRKFFLLFSIACSCVSLIFLNLYNTNRSVYLLFLVGLGFYFAASSFARYQGENAAMGAVQKFHNMIKGKHYFLSAIISKKDNDPLFVFYNKTLGKYYVVYVFPKYWNFEKPIIGDIYIRNGEKLHHFDIEDQSEIDVGGMLFIK